MSEQFGFCVVYDAPYDEESLRASFGAYHAAVVENWARHADELSWWALDDEEIGVEALVAQTLPDRLKPFPYSPDFRTIDILYLPFSPLTRWIGWLAMSRNKEGRLSIGFSVCDRVRNGSDHERLRFRQELDPSFEDPWYTPPRLPDVNDPGFEAKLDELWEWRPTHNYRDHEELWVDNRDCLRNLFARLREALPTVEVSIDDVIAKGED